MLLSELFETMLPVRGLGRVEIFENPTRSALMALLDFSKEQRVRGLMLDDGRVMWWDAYDATHGDVASIYDRAYDDIENLFRYKKHRLELKKDGARLHLFAGETEAGLLANPNVSFLINPRITLTTTFKNFN